MLHFQTLLRRAATAASSLPPQQRRAALLLGGVGVTGVVASQFMQGSTPAKVCAASWGVVRDTDARGLRAAFDDLR